MKKLFIYNLLFISAVIFAQEKDSNLPKGNDAFSEKEYAKAEVNYRISEFKNPKKAVASYNLGNTIYKFNQPSEAKFAYGRAIESAKTRNEKHEILHNLGNVFMKEKDYTKAVQAYKDALRNNPSDEETRYNYALAKKMLKENPPKAEDKKDKKKDKKDNKDKKDQGDNKDKKDKGQDKEKENKEGDGKDKAQQGNKPENQNKKPQRGGISKERLENLLEAVDNEEKKVQDKVNKHKAKGRPVQTEKDW